MKLSEWREEREWTQERLAEELGCTALTVYRYETGRRMPDREAMEKIFFVTEGKVEPNDFYPLGDWRRRLAAILERARELLRGKAA